MGPRRSSLFAWGSGLAKRATLAGSVALLVVLALGSDVRADRYGFADYTYETSSCTGPKDPLNMFFYNFDWTQAEAAVRNVLGLTWDIFASDQYFRYRWRDGIT